MENWEIIEEFPDYSVNENGEVYSHISERILKPSKTKKGYLRICLYKDGKVKKFYVHRLVAKAFLLNLENKPEVDHIDRDKTNNNINNLRWANKSEQQLNVGYRYFKQDGLHNITLRKNGSCQVKISIKFKIHRKSFKTVEEAIIHRDKYILENPK